MSAPLPEPAAPAVETRSLTRPRAWIDGPLRMAAFVAFWGPIVAAATLKVLGLSHTDFGQHIVKPLFPSFLPVSIALAALAILVPRLRREGRATLEIVGDALRIRTKRAERTLPKADVVSGIVAPTPTGAVMDLRLRNGTVLRAVDVDRDRAERTLAALDVGPRGRRAIVTLGSATRTVWVALGGVFAWFAVLGVVVDQKYTHTQAFSIAWVFAGLVLSWLVTRLARPREIAVGSDGVSVRGAFGSKFIPFERITGVDLDRALVLELDGVRILAIRGGTLPDRRSLAERIRAARAAHAEVNASTDARLARAGRTVRAWRQALGAAVRAGDSYRASALRPESLEAVLVDPASPAERRIGAALALAESRVPGARERIRIAADACAQDRLRVAIAEVAKGEPDEAAIEAALQEREAESEAAASQ